MSSVLGEGIGDVGVSQQRGGIARRAAGGRIVVALGVARRGRACGHRMCPAGLSYIPSLYIAYCVLGISKVDDMLYLIARSRYKADGRQTCRGK